MTLGELDLLKSCHKKIVKNPMAPKDKKGGSVLGRLKSNLKGLGLLGNAQRNKQSDKKFDSKRDKMTAIK